MIKFLKISLIAVLFFIAKPTFAAEPIQLYLFYGDGCPHCAKEEKFLNKLKEENKNIEVNMYEVWRNRENAKILSDISEKMNFNVSVVPVLIIGDEVIPGYYNDETTGEKIKALINEYTETGCTDKVSEVMGWTKVEETCMHGCHEKGQECMHDCGCSADNIKTTTMPEDINLPLFGKVDIASLSLPFLTVIIAAIDGFNPCAMWVLLFLINLLLGMEDHKKMWIFGSAFILASGAVYFLFLSAWLNLFIFLGLVFWIRVIIGMVAVGSGVYHLREYKKNKEGTCKVTANEKRKAVFSRLKELVLQKNFLVGLVGIILLAGAVNLVELVCSAGLPAVYTQVLALSDIATWKYYSYLILYIFIFMLDDMIIFAIAMFTLQLRVGSSVKYVRMSNLIGGIIMLILGLLLIFKPGWIMFA